MHSATFTYDALGRRVSKTINGITTEYLYDGNDIVAEIQSGEMTATYLRSLNIDEPFMRFTATGAEYYHTDALGSVIALTDSSGTTTTTYRYDPFGSTTMTGTSTNPFQYTGREDDGTGLYYYRARYYSPRLQRFISEDPLLQPFAEVKGCCPSCLAAVGAGSLPLLITDNPVLLNAYNYVGNNPLTFIDPFGLDRKNCFAIATGFGVMCSVSCQVGCLALPPPANAICLGTCPATCAGISFMIRIECAAGS